jgi:hypothetical protein
MEIFTDIYLTKYEEIIVYYYIHSDIYTTKMAD